MDENTPVVPEPVEAAADSVRSRKVGISVFGLVMLLMVAVVVFAFAPKGKSADGTLPADPVGYALPDLTLQQLGSSQQVSLSDFKGKPLVINFWASWCTTCKEEAALLGAAEKQWRDQGVVFIGIDSSDEDASAIAFGKQYGMDYISLVDPDGVVAPNWAVTGFPETFFVDANGRIVSKYISAIDEATLSSSISAIVN